MVSLWDAIRKGLGIAKEDVELGEELIEGRTPSGVGSAEDYQLGPDDGVRVSPMPVTAQSEIVVSYSGLLAKAGATELFLHCGEGPGEWRNVRDVPMEEGPQGTWTARLTAGDGGTLEFCFHDAAGTGITTTASTGASPFTPGAIRTRRVGSLHPPAIRRRFFRPSVRAPNPGNIGWQEARGAGGNLS